ncbi:MAG: GNAT family N-acetyltransferase [Acidimicrobiia bacterium]|nr:GNAT family N-acetyltransferase [Acidimicrobiia bacterium]
MARGMRLSDGVVELRAPRRSDTTELHRAIQESMPELRPWMAWAHPDYSDIEAGEWVRRAARAFSEGVEFQFVARELEHGELLGTVGLNTIDRVNRWANLGYWLRTRHTGRGYMTRAARLVADVGFSELVLGRIEILAAVANLPSQGVARRLGAQREGVLRHRLRVGDETQDAVVYSLIAAEPPNS